MTTFSSYQHEFHFLNNRKDFIKFLKVMANHVKDDNGDKSLTIELPTGDSQCYWPCVYVTPQKLLQWINR